MRVFEEIAFLFVMAVILFTAAWVGCSSVQEAHDKAPKHRYYQAHDTVF